MDSTFDADDSRFYERHPLGILIVLVTIAGAVGFLQMQLALWQPVMETLAR